MPLGGNPKNTMRSVIYNDMLSDVLCTYISPPMTNELWNPCKDLKAKHLETHYSSIFSICGPSNLGIASNVHFE